LDLFGDEKIAFDLKPKDEPRHGVCRERDTEPTTARHY
jgi:hypothetical protein